uniref:exodeoxyribonuclease VII large subunit n=2 Tax=Brevundimonas TaxID=41275 RepID=UPI0026EA9130
ERGQDRLRGAADRLGSALQAGVARNERRLLQTAGRLSPAPLHRRLDQRQARLEALSVRLDGVMPRRLERAEDRLASLSRALTTLNPKTPKPGFARIEDAQGAMIASAAALSPGQTVQIVFGDGAKGATIDGEGGMPRPTPKSAPRPKAPPAGQGDLF